VTSRHGPSGWKRDQQTIENCLQRWPPRVTTKREWIATLPPGRRRRWDWLQRWPSKVTTAGTKPSLVILGQAQRWSVEPFRDRGKRWDP